MCTKQRTTLSTGSQQSLNAAADVGSLDATTVSISTGGLMKTRVVIVG
jgi:hypothetical protein